MNYIKTQKDARDLEYDTIYIAAMVTNPPALKKMFPQVHTNGYYHHSTIEFRPVMTETLLHNVGKAVNLKVRARVTTDKVDALVVENPGSTNKYPHITLSTAEGVQPFESNSEIEKAFKIGSIDTTIESFTSDFPVVKSIVGLAVNLKIEKL